MKADIKQSSSKNEKYKVVLITCLCFSLLLNQIAFAQGINAPNDKQQHHDIKKVELQAVLTPPYVIGPGDGLTITDRTLKDVFGQVETFTVVVSADGYITVPLPDGSQANILAAGSTLDEISEQIRELFGRVLINPLVFVQISKYRSLNIYVGGDVVKSGVFKINSSAADSFTITEAIQLAGGLKPRADIRNIIVTRGANLEKKVVDLYQIITGENRYQDINLQPGDAIFVPTSTEYANQAQNNVLLLGMLAYQEVPINVVGQAESTGSFTLPNDATLVDAIGMAGGTSKLGTLKRVKLSRYDENGVYRTEKINLLDLLAKGTTADQIVLKPNDTIEILPSPLKTTANYLKTATTNLYSIVLGGFTGAYVNFLFQKKILDLNFERAKKSSLGALGAASILRPPVDNSITVIESSSERKNKQ